MSDVFISYARVDRDFVKKVFAGLEAHEREVWVDWDDIRPTEKWREAVFRGIESATTCICVLSPGFANSSMCREEAEYAQLHNKRLVPLMHQTVESQQLPSVLAELHWVDFLKQEFDGAIEELLSVMEEDLDWLLEHKRLLVRAIDWQQGSGDASYLLRGKELESALHWLTDAANHQEPPTNQQIALVRESQHWQASEVKRYQELYETAESQRATAEDRLADGVQVAENMLGAIENRLTGSAEGQDLRQELLRSVSSLIERLREGARENIATVPVLIASHREQGRLAESHGTISAAAQAYRNSVEAAEERKNDFKDDPAFLESLAANSRSLGVTSAVAGDQKTEGESLDKALGFGLQLVAEYPERPEFSYELSRTYLELGASALRNNDLHVAHDTHVKLMELTAALVRAYPELREYRLSHARAHISLADLQLEEEHVATAQATMAKGTAILESLRISDALDHEVTLELAKAYSKGASLSRHVGAPDSARIAYGRSLSALMELQEADPKRVDYQFAHAVVLRESGDFLSENGEPGEARHRLQTALGILVDLRERDPENILYAWANAAVCTDLGKFAERIGHDREAQKWFSESRHIKIRLVDQDPANVRWQRDLLQTYLDLVRIRVGEDTANEHNAIAAIVAHLCAIGSTEHPVLDAAFKVLNEHKASQSDQQIMLGDAMLASVIIRSPLLVTLPTGFVAKHLDENDPLAGIIWGTPDDAALIVATGDFTKIKHGVFIARLSTSVAYLGDGRFSEEDDIPAMLESLGGTEVQCAKHEFHNHAALEVSASIDEKFVRMFYLALNIDSNAIFVDYHHPKPNKPVDGQVWQKFIEGFSLQHASTWDRGQNAAEVLSLVVARLWLLTSYKVRLYIKTTTGPEHANPKPFVRQDSRMSVQDRRLVELTTDLDCSSAMEYTDNGSSFIENFEGGVFGSGPVRVTKQGGSPPTYFGEGIKQTLGPPETEPQFNGLCVLAGFPLICDAPIEALLAAQFSYYDLRSVEETEGRIVFEGSIRRDVAAAELARGLFQPAHIDDVLARIASIRIHIRRDDYQWERTHVTGRFDRFPFETTMQLLGIETQGVRGFDEVRKSMSNSKPASTGTWSRLPLLWQSIRRK